jgi:L-gulono-1,4-lactone dehydrogenase
VSSESPTIVNFGRNVSFQPQVLMAPRSEAEVLRVLKQYEERCIRVMGRLHSWSQAPRGDDVLLDLRHLNGVQTEERDGGVWATIGAGCQIKRVLAELERQAGMTLPSVGLITEQTMAGAISTGTHGSGKSSLSHYIAEVRIATYDTATGEPVIRTISDGLELRAARCSLGCLGVIVSVGLWTCPQYRVEEHFCLYKTLDEVLAAEHEYPLQQFYFMPWSWRFYAHHRREVTQPRSWLAPLYRLYCFLAFDLGLHVLMQVPAKWWRSRWATHFFFRHLLPWSVIRHWKVTDKSQAMLVMKHELFRHIEIEVFVKRSRLDAAVSFVVELLRHFDGEPNALSPATQQRLQSLGLLESLVPCAGSYTHHYLICGRRVLPDDTLISLASSDDEDYYALSFISYARPCDRESFFQFAEHLVRTTAALFQARPHWGKHCPIDSATVAALYPHLAQFRNVCSRLDPTGRFRNEWVSRLLFENRDPQW